MPGPTTGRALKTTQTSLRILELVLEHEGLTLAELDGLVDKPKSSLHSHLETLRGCRYLKRNGHTYEVSFRLALLGEQVRRRTRLDTVATDIVTDLSKRTGEEANFTVLEHGRLLMLCGSAPTAAHDDDGFRREYYLHNTAAGKAILAEMDREQVEAVLDRWGMPRETEATIADRDRLFDALDETKRRGYGIVDEEFAPGLLAVGATVHDEDGTLLGGLSVGGPKYRIDTAQLYGDLADAVLEAVDTLEQTLLQ
ncbi:IclR family transcriptional regulator [Halalkalirubrum salinum]|uniref:IclR family transcriptional regulator n=1 Tax=Halalkalirubrum salinum TaxID=2563889 RepID=UPI0010FB342A|nr:IclR family transcriptional regulator [Halalkalirubrum salinum]